MDTAELRVEIQDALKAGDAEILFSQRVDLSKIEDVRTHVEAMPFCGWVVRQPVKGRAILEIYYRFYDTILNTNARNLLLSDELSSG